MRLFLLFTFTSCAMIAQESFEVATVRPVDLSKLEPGMSTLFSPGPPFRMQGYTLKGLVQFAYELEDFELSGGPGWFDKDRFDIDGKAPDGANTGMAATKRRLRALLEDRFQLRTHKETKQATILVLSVNKGGPKLKASQDDPTSGSGPGSIKVSGGQLSLLAQMLSSQLRQKVVDRTGLADKFDYQLKWAPDASLAEGPSLITALQEQLGLRLDSEKGPIEVLVVDRAEKPTDN